MQRYTIAPSLLSADFARLGEEVSAVIEAGADLLHLDVMDNHYVPNLTFGPGLCRAIKPYAKVPLDVHLMVKPVDNLIPAFAKAGAQRLSIHLEATDHVDRTLALIKEQGCQAGLAFNPGTPLNALEYVWDRIDYVLILLVNPGFGGQQCLPIARKKIADARQKIDAYTRSSSRLISLAVDGGVNVENAAALAAAGADTFIAGSAIFGQPNYAHSISKLRAALTAR